MPRYKITIEYDGTNFAGWQKQKGAPSVQSALEEAIARFSLHESDEVSREAIAVYGAGRTDAGVHATGQVAHFDLERDNMTPFSIMNAINFHLRPHPIVVVGAEVVAPDWHARFSAVSKIYRYKILNRYTPSVLEQHRVFHVKRLLDVSLMQIAGEALLGSHDFSSFRAAACQAKSAIRTLDEVVVEHNGDRIDLFFRARSFLHNQVRIMVGAMVACGLDPTLSIAKILEARDRKAAPITAPACGLYLERIRYDEFT
jgi:tRNA pseudouridine38-40 synthase